MEIKEMNEEDEMEMEMEMEMEIEIEMAQVCNREYKVLIVGYDVQSLIMLQEMLQACGYNVTKCQNSKMLISMLQEDPKRFDIVIIDLHMPEKNNGFEIIRRSIGLKMDLLVIMMISDYNEDVIRKGIICGACDYLLKPIQAEYVRHLWKHVYRKERQHCLSVKRSGEGRNSDTNVKESRNNANLSISEDHNDGSGMRKKKNDATNKARMVWTTKLHQKFMDACNQLGNEKATPKRILSMMNEPTLSRASVASHLQKYRQGQNLRKKPRSQHQKSSSPSTSTNISSHDLEPQANCRASSSNSNSQIDVPESLVEMENHQPQTIHHTWDFANGVDIVPCSAPSTSKYSPMPIIQNASQTNMNYPILGHFEEAIRNQNLETTNEFDLIRGNVEKLQTMQKYLQYQKQNELYSQRQSNGSVIRMEYSLGNSPNNMSTITNLQAQVYPAPSLNPPPQIQVSKLVQLRSHQPQSQTFQYTSDNANGFPMPHPQLIHYPPVNNGLPSIPMALNHNLIYPNMNYRHPHHFEGINHPPPS